MLIGQKPDGNQQSVPLQSGRVDGTSQGPFSPPSMSLPKGGGAIRGLGEKFGANPVTGTGSLSVPIYTSPGRSGFGPQLTLSYDSGAGNGPFGFGWSLSLPSITRKTDKGLPKYQDAEESDVFILSGAEDLVPVLVKQGDKWIRETLSPRKVNGIDYRIQRYRPRIEGLFARIERWTNQADPSDSFWRSISKDNITTWYGKTAESRIADPADPARIFSWLICESFDDKGNVIVYQYKAENSDGVVLSQVHEKNRTPSSRSANRYLKRLKYGNHAPYLPKLLANQPWPSPPGANAPDGSSNWLFEVVFDYGEHDAEKPTPNDPGKWLRRHDPFSSYRAGFEVRTYRLCERVLMFHHFPDELGTADYLVRSTDFTYNQSPIASFITQVIQSGYVRQANGTYLKKSLAPLAFEYTQAVVNEEIQVVDPQSLENLPVGADGLRYQWLDLDGEGLQGVLSEQQDGWYYKRNLSPISVVKENGKEKLVARFEPLAEVASHPSIAEGAGVRHQFLDLAGDGQLDLVQFETPVSGFFERTEDEQWDSFVPFGSVPNLTWNDPNLKFLDLTGDGHADILITENDALTWYPSLAEEGFGTAIRIPKPRDEEEGPAVVFADGTQAIFVADMSGDGLSDIVRIRNGEVCYWPNLGYGRFGPKVTMDNAPWFDAPDQFDQKRVRLADIDGSGNTDIIYLGSDGVRLYFNQSGNGWSEAKKLTVFPRVDNLSSVQALDLLGNGTACLVWTSPLPGDASRPMRYIDLMSGQKPHLLIKTVNNLGAETVVEYAPSTKFYLADKAAGKPWITRLPFPVHVVERVETYDRVSRNRFVTRYAYHHGYFDGIEREFRGFGMVEQRDTEEFAALSASDDFPEATNIDAASHVPPVLTKTWFHTGAYLEGGRISNFFAGLLDGKDIGEYYREPGLNDEQAKKLLLDDTVLPDGLTPEEEREACRSLKGSMLRQEVYALDGTSKEEHPYVVTEQNFTIRQLQPIAGNRHSVFFTHAREAISYHYERTLVPGLNGQIVDEITAATNPNVKWQPDPRVAHTLTLEVDKFGNVRKLLAIGYGRRQPDMSLSLEDRAKQTQTFITYTENEVTNPIDDVKNDPDNYRTPLPSETRTYELTGFRPAGNAGRFSFDEWVNNDFALLKSPTEIAYEQVANPAKKQKRLIGHVRTLYRKNDLSSLLPFSQLQSLALPGESYKLAFTPGLLASTYKRGAENLLPEPAGVLGSKGTDGGAYVRSNDHKAKNLFPATDLDDHWWIPSGRQVFDASHFYLPIKFIDPWNQEFITTYDAPYFLLVVKTEDPLQNVIKAKNNYRVMLPWYIIDPNENRSAVRFDELGMVVATAVMGKSGQNEGDTLDETATEVSPSDDPTTRLEYDLLNWMLNGSPNFVHTFAREQHGAANPRWQESYTYSDGFGREIQKKMQAEPGPVKEGGLDVSPRWVGSGWTIFNNKGKPVRQYEPFFDDTHDFRFAKKVGVSPILFYDSIERVIATLHPNHTYEKVVFDPWQQTTYDVNDTVAANGTETGDPRTDADIQGYVAEYFKTQPNTWQTWHQEHITGAKGAQEKSAAEKAAKHANTPTKAHFDTLGRTFLTIADNGPVGKYETRVELDIEGNQREVIDAKGRVVMRYDYDMLGNRIQQNSMDAGERWMLNDVAGKPIRAWNSRGHEFRTEYDDLRRPLHTFVKGADPQDPNKEILFERTEYGENQPNDTQLNLRTKVFRQFDGAGVVTNMGYNPVANKDEAYDFKGNLLRSSRQLAADYKATPNWSVSVALEPGIFISSTTYDALNRPISLTTPDKSEILPTYNEANLLEKVDVHLRGASESTPFVKDIDYDAKGQRELIQYGSGVKTEYKYDEKTFRLIKLKTIRPTDNATLQNLTYTYDPVGNITQIRDDAQQTIYFNNTVVDPHTAYVYDAIYRLVKAKGREHKGQATPQPDKFRPEYDYDDLPRVNLPHPNDGNAMRDYTEKYDYDEVGNILKMIHGANGGNWTREYVYANGNNRLLKTSLPGNLFGDYGYDEHGSMTKMPHLPHMEWNFEDQLQEVDFGGGGKAYYVYNAAGQRVRKVVEKNDGSLTEEHIYLGGYEIFRQRNGDGVKLERETLHIMDDKRRIALVETKTVDEGATIQSPTSLIRYQLSNHLGSASLELDAAGEIISYEEYYPYGSTSYQAGPNAAEVSLKRYRYTGKERDEESGLYYHGARYYACWLGRWTSCDPVGFVDEANLYGYSDANPITLHDPNGMDPRPSPNDPRVRDYEQRLRRVRGHLIAAGGKNSPFASFRVKGSGASKGAGNVPQSAMPPSGSKGGSGAPKGYQSVDGGQDDPHRGKEGGDAAPSGSTAQEGNAPGSGADVPWYERWAATLGIIGVIMSGNANAVSPEKNVSQTPGPLGAGRAALNALIGVGLIAMTFIGETLSLLGKGVGKLAKWAGKLLPEFDFALDLKGLASELAPAKIGPAADIPEHLNPAAFAERGVFEVTNRAMYVVRVGGPKGSFGFQKFETLQEAEKFARELAAKGRAAIRNEFAIKESWNEVKAVSVYEMPAGTPTVSGVTAPQVETGKVYPGGGWQVAFPEGSLAPKRSFAVSGR